MTNLAITGCRGRMGQRITALARADKDLKITTLLERPGHPETGKTFEGIGVAVAADTAAIKGCDVMIDFTTPESTLQNLEACRRHGVKLVIGTTGLTADQNARIRDAAADIAIVYSSNMSVGVNLVFKLAAMIGQAAPSTYRVRIEETHHVHKKDAPSGTAKTLAACVEEAGVHQAGDIASFREGEVIGDHKVIFENDEDIIVLEHHAKSRDIFAKGSLVAAKFLMNKKSGLFSMQDVLGL